MLKESFSSFGSSVKNIITFNPHPNTYLKPFPLTEAIQQSFLETKEGHKVFYETFGNPTQPAILLVHGGPGAPFLEYRQFINPENNYIIFVHQRGCGMSLPMGKLEGNDTFALVSDFKKILDILNIKKIALHGHSWGGPLSLAFAGTHPEMIDYVLLRGSADGDKHGAWLKLHKTGPEQFPDYWLNLIENLSEADKKDLCQTFYDKFVLHSEDPSTIEYAEKFLAYNHALSVVQVDPILPSSDYTVTFKLNLVKLYFHYIQHNFFLGEEKMLDLAKKITAPILCLHGRHDRNCYPENSEKIIRAAQQGLMIMVEGASHNALSPAMANALVRSVELMEQNFR